MKIEDIIVKSIIPLILCIFIAFKSSDISYDYPDFMHEIYDEPFYKLVIFGFLVLITQKNYTIGSKTLFTQIQKIPPSSN